jgi:subtilisin-like proprotein convertase family protein
MTRRLARLGLSVVGVLALLAIAGSPALAKAKTKTATVTQCVDPGAVIGEKGLASAVVNIAVPKNGKKVQDGIVTAVQAGTRITYPGVSELNMTLVSPGGKAISLVATDSGADGTGYGAGASGCSGSLVQFGDAFATSITETTNPSTEPLTGQFRPQQPLAPVLGGPARGPWVLLVTNCCENNTGTFNAFSLNLTYTYKAQVKKKKGKKKK